MSKGTNLSPYKSVVRERYFRRLLFGQGLSMAGDAICLAALPLAIIHVGLSAANFSFMMGGVGLGTLVGASFGGALADRVSPRNVLVCTDLVRGCVQFVATVLLFVAPAALPLVICYLLFGIGIGVSRPCAQVLITELLPRRSLIAGNGLMNFVDNLAAVALPGSVGVAIIAWNPILGVLLDGVTFIVAAGFTVFIPNAGGYENEEFHLRDVLAGIPAVAQDRRLTVGMLSTVLLNVLCFPIFLVIAPFAVSQRYSESIWGYCLAAFGLGACTGSLVMVHFKAHGFIQRLSLICGSVLAVGLVLVGIGHSVPEVLAGSIAVGFVEAAWLTSWSTAMQLYSPPDELGRVTAIDTVLTAGGLPIVFVCGGVLGASIGYPVSLLGAAGLCILGVAAANILPAMLRALGVAR